MIETTGMRARWAAMSADPARTARLALARAVRAAEPRAGAATRERPYRDDQWLLAAFPPAPVPPATGPVLHLYGEVGWDIRADDLAADLGQLGGRDVTVYLSSPGGQASEGIDC
jgi:hypothetical protein